MREPQQSTTNLNVLPRFFAAPKLDERMKEILSVPTIRKREKRKTAMIRYAAYLRISSEEQVGNYSIDAQRRAVETWVKAQEGRLVRVYVDEAQSGRTADRPGFLEMRKDARKRLFDALVVHKFDRFARNRTDALAIKSLLRYDYGIKVFSVSEPSEDSDGPIGALIEGIMESVAEWYSKNLASEVSKGRREKGQQGLHNNHAPFGLKREGKLLVPNEVELPGLILAFKTYATGHYSYGDIAKLLNQEGYHSTSGRPFSKDTVREILRNEIYLGKVRYQETRRGSDGRRSFSAPILWFKGQHAAIIDQELFDQCNSARTERAVHMQSRAKFRPYLLRSLVYCYHCCSNPPKACDFPSWGKMHCQHNRSYLYYRCEASMEGFDCPQRGARTEEIDTQVFGLLCNLKPPADWQQKVLRTVSEILGERSLEERLKEIRETIERMDFRWDSGFITDKGDYLEKRLRLQQELEKLTPVNEDLSVAVDLLTNFLPHLEACKGDIEKMHRLISLIVERVYVSGNKVVALTLKADYHVVLGHNGNEPTFVEVDPFVHEWARRDLNP